MSSQSSNTESLSRFPLWQVITPVRRKVILAMALAGLAALTSLGALLFLAWSLRDIRATPDAIPAWPLGGVIGCVVLTFVLRLQAFNTSHYAAFHLENILRSRLARKALQLPPGVLQQMGSGSVAKVMLDDVKSLHIFVADSTAALCPRDHHAAGDNRYLVLAGLAAGNRDAGGTGVWIGCSRARPPAFGRYGSALS